MIKLNLEQELLQENKRLATPKELLLIREFETHTALVQNDTLTRVGLNKTLKEGKSLKDKQNHLLDQTSRFDKARVFHISQIKSICQKYHLRFLNTSYYNGSIDEELPNKISNFEIIYGVKCDSRNTYIIAPSDSFKLKERPKDPLMFYKINDEYFYLIHKWGNDLSITRMLLPYLSNKMMTWLTISFLFTSPLLLLPGIIGSIFYAAGVFVSSLAIGIYNDSQWRDEEKLRFVKKIDWDSEFTD
jgi:hypothetical protein